ncbi:MAG: hypothetical protein IJ880_17535 [Bacilli bacterium]|nr:hypothetical protein [Bacilli bacterium]
MNTEIDITLSNILNKINEELKLINSTDENGEQSTYEDDRDVSETICHLASAFDTLIHNKT